MTRASACATILECIRNGVTTIFDHHASFCAEKTLPYRNKLTVFTDRAALADSQNAGFTYLPESGRFLLRWAGICREADPADEGVPPEVGRVMAAVRDSYPWLLYK